MSTLAEIEAARIRCHQNNSRNCFCFSPRACAAVALNSHPPREFTKEQIAAWIAEDEADMEQFRKGL